MIIISAGLCDYVNLAPRLCAILHIVQSAANSILLDRILRNLQPGL